MRYLFQIWDRIETLVRESPHVLLMTDYDGTLTPIRRRPDEALLDSSFRKVLKRISKRKKFSLSIISGRKLADVRRLVRLRTICYAGNHGFEIKGPRISFLHPATRKGSPHLARISKMLRSRSRDIKGAIIENKGASISLHYRLVPDRLVKKLRNIFDDICAPYKKRGRIKLASGKKVWEVQLPVRWHKGKAVEKILKTFSESKTLPIYLGDDATDEDAFRALRRRKAITVFVGNKKKSAARYYLRSPREVKTFLVRLCRI